MPSAALTALENTLALALDYHVKEGTFQQSIQDKPLIKALEGKKKSFASGKGAITYRVKFDITPNHQGYEDDDEVDYVNPQNTKQVSYDWKEVHGGITVTDSELKIGGYSAVSDLGINASKHAGTDATELGDILQDKLDEFTEAFARGQNEMYWGDGTADAKKLAGIQSFIKPGSEITGGSNLLALGTTGGISRVSNPLWRNRSKKFTYASGQTVIVEGLAKEILQLRRYGKAKNMAILCGSGFLEKLRAEIAAKSLFSQSGLSANTDVSIGMPQLLGIGQFIYDPTLDDLLDWEQDEATQTDYCYIIDLDAIHLRVMKGEEYKTHKPARPENVYAYYQGMTWTGAMCATKLNSSGVYKAV